jgi:hypothetical protein
MSLITEIFGRKISGESLKDLMKLLDIPENCLQNFSSEWVVENYWGKCAAKIEDKGIEVDFYIFRKDLHTREKESLYQTEKYHFKKMVPYENIKPVPSVF